MSLAMPLEKKSSRSLTTDLKKLKRWKDLNTEKFKIITRKYMGLIYNLGMLKNNMNP